MTKTLLALASGLALAASAAAAHAEGRVAEATLATAPAKAQTLVVEDFRWRCDGVACTGAVGPSKIDVARACKQLGRKFGPVAAFTVGGVAADAETLTTCNADAKK